MSEAGDGSGNKSKSLRTADRQRVTVLFSGRGSNMAVLIAASMAADYPAVITHAITNRPGAGGIAIAEEHGIPVDVADHKSFATREAHEAEIARLIDASKPDIICLAGYMRILSEGFVKRYRGKILNIHPSLLPSFKGVDTHHRAREEGCRIHGCTVHFVDETLDGGPIVAQAAIPIQPRDTDETLQARVLKAEHRLYPHALRLVASGQVRHSGGRVINAAPAADEAAVLFSPPLPGTA